MNERTMTACLTGRRAAALATVAVYGPRAWDIVRALVRPVSTTGRPLPEVPLPGRFWVGRFSEEPDATFADEVVVAAKRVGGSLWVEVHCHGGVQVVRWLMDALDRRGAQPCSASELERSAGSPARVLALAALAEAPTVRTAAVLLDQVHGALQRPVDEASLALARRDLPEAKRILRATLRHAAVGRHLTTPWRVAVIGAPNVGKSSLVNALAGYQRSIVSPTPGTTRDVVATMLALDGWPVELLDTAGWRKAEEPLEREGVARARVAAAEADLDLWVLDASAPPQWPEVARASDVADGAMRFVINKVDLPAAWNLDSACDALRLSALTRQGIAELAEALSRWLVPVPPRAGEAVPFTPALATCLEIALEHVVAGRAEDAERLLQSAWNDDIDQSRRPRSNPFAVARKR